MADPFDPGTGEIPVLTPLAARAHLIVENKWRDRVAEALRQHGYTEVGVETPVKNGRVDVTFTRHAIEIDWSNKWAESIGQALYYGLCCQSRAVSLLLLESDAGRVHVEIARQVAANNTPPLQVWVLDIRTGVLDMGHGRTINVG